MNFLSRTEKGIILTTKSVQGTSQLFRNFVLFFQRKQPLLVPKACISGRKKNLQLTTKDSENEAL